MEQTEQSDMTCGNCDSAVTPSATFCHNCGSVFVESIHCQQHPATSAEGICVICQSACCSECGGENMGVFLCDEHWAYEIQEGMARVYGSTDNVQAQHVCTCLDQAGFHPFFFSRRFNPGADVVAIIGVRNFGDHPIQEMKVLVPFSEVLNAEKELDKLGFSESHERRTG